MAVYIIRRFFYIIPVLFAVAVLGFLLVHLVPGDPTATLLGSQATPGAMEKIKKQLGLKEPLYIQFFQWFTKALKGDLGRSIFLGIPVNQALKERLPVTVELSTLALIFSIIIGLPSGILAAVKQNTLIDRIAMLFAISGVSIPSFWLGLNLMMIFSVNLRWFPIGGYIPFLKDPMGNFRSLFLPTITLGLVEAAYIARVARSSTLEMLRQDFISTARAKGLRELVVISKHVGRNAIIPVITVMGLIFGTLLGGAIVTEFVFNLPGVGRLAVTAVSRRDYPVIQGVLLLIASGYAIVNLVVDILYVYVDPRIKYE